MRKIFKLEKKAAIKILFALNELGECRVTDLMRLLKEKYQTGSNTFYSSLKILENLTLIEERRFRSTKGGPIRRVIRLTDKGRKVTNFLIKINELL